MPAVLRPKDWLTIWEDAHALPATLRPCALLASALAVDRAVVERMPLGRRDRQLLGLYSGLFGDHLPATAVCPACHERVELTVEASQLQLAVPDTPAISDDAVEVRWQDFVVRCRLPDTRDLMAVAGVSDLRRAETALLERCVVACRRGEDDVPVTALPTEAIAELERTLGDADPHAIVALSLECPGCGRAWSERLDVASYLFEVMANWAERLIDEIHTLARAYGWREDDLLELSPARRAQYLARVSM